MKLWVWTGAGTALVLLVLAGCKATRAGYESPVYKTTKKDGRFELRAYEGFTIVSTIMNRDNPDQDGGFMKLFGYIQGENASTQKIAMTTPVLVSSATNKSQMSFVVPRTIEASGTPKPKSENLSLKQVQTGLYATCRFKGSRSGKNPEEAREQLLQWIEKSGYRALAAPFFAYYDPPWIPGFLRRNEVLIQINPPVTDKN
jgi:DNA gyrase inhibitor GyrI